MNPRQTVEVNGRYFYPKDQPPIDPLPLVAKPVDKDVLTIQVMDRVPADYVPSIATRGISFGQPGQLPKPGELKRTTDRLMLRGYFQVRIARA